LIGKNQAGPSDRDVSRITHFHTRANMSAVCRQKPGAAGLAGALPKLRPDLGQHVVGRAQQRGQQWPVKAPREPATRAARERPSDRDVVVGRDLAILPQRLEGRPGLASVQRLQACGQLDVQTLHYPWDSHPRAECQPSTEPATPGLSGSRKVNLRSNRWGRYRPSLLSEQWALFAARI
jgi:hypothetical protein